ncbi:MAG: hypothetical protein AB9903_01350 [Vulcanimicrobiota bacterium]
MKKTFTVLACALLLISLCAPLWAAELVGMVSRMEGSVGVVSIPGSKGIQPGMIMYLYRQGKYIGRAEVSEVSQICSRIMSLPECKGMKVGDAVLSLPAEETYRPPVHTCKNVQPEFILRESDGRAVVVGKIETANLEKVREEYHLGVKVVQFQSIDTGEEFYRILSQSGTINMLLQPGTYVVDSVHIVGLAGVSYNAWGIPIGIVPGFLMKKGGKSFPISYKFQVPEKSDVVYIGTLKFTIDPKNPFTKKYTDLPTYTSVVDEYDQAMADFEKLNPYVQRISSLPERHLEAKAEKSLMELVPDGPGSLFEARGDFKMAMKEYFDMANYYEAPYRARAHNALGNYYFQREKWLDSCIQYDLARQLGYPVSDDRIKALVPYRYYTKPYFD